MRIAESIRIQGKIISFALHVPKKRATELGLQVDDGCRYSTLRHFGGVDAPVKAIQYLKALAIGFRVDHPDDYTELRGLMDLCQACMDFISGTDGDIVDTSRYDFRCNQNGDFDFSARREFGNTGFMSNITVTMTDIRKTVTVEFLRKLAKDALKFRIQPRLVLDASNPENPHFNGEYEIAWYEYEWYPDRNLLKAYGIQELKAIITHAGNTETPRVIHTIDELVGIPIQNLRAEIRGTTDDGRHFTVGAYSLIPSFKVEDNGLWGRGKLIPDSACIDDMPRHDADLKMEN